MSTASKRPRETDGELQASSSPSEIDMINDMSELALTKSMLQSLRWRAGTWGEFPGAWGDIRHVDDGFLHDCISKYVSGSNCGLMIVSRVGNPNGLHEIWRDAHKRYAEFWLKVI